MCREDDGMLFSIGEDGVLRQYKEPFATIECPTEEDYNCLINLANENKELKEKLKKYESEEK